MSIRTLLITGAAAVALSGPALAADLPAQPIEPAPITMPLAYDWSGFYVGAQVGYAWAGTDIEIDGYDTDLSPDADGVVGGVFIGYNVMFNQVVVGLEADIEATSISGDDDWDDGNDAFDADNDSNWQGSVRARLGYAFDNFLPYIQGGVAFLDRDVSIHHRGLDITVEDSDTFTGWTVGAGLEYGFTPNFTARVEYRYTDFGDSDFDFNGNDVNADLTTNTVRVGVAYKF
jgi:outer membrane immunogenic protein